MPPAHQVVLLAIDSRGVQLVVLRRLPWQPATVEACIHKGTGLALMYTLTYTGLAMAGRIMGVLVYSAH